MDMISKASKRPTLCGSAQRRKIGSSCYTVNWQTSMTREDQNPSSRMNRNTFGSANGKGYRWRRQTQGYWTKPRHPNRYPTKAGRVSTVE